MNAQEARRLAEQIEKEKLLEEVEKQAEAYAKEVAWRNKQSPKVKEFYRRFFPGEVSKAIHAGRNEINYVDKTYEFEDENGKVSYWFCSTFLELLGNMLRQDGYEAKFSSFMSRPCDECREQEAWSLEIKW